MQGGIINTIFALVIAVIIIWLIWGISIYYLEWGSEEGKREGKTLTLGATTALFLVMVIYALVVWARASTGI